MAVEKISTEEENSVTMKTLYVAEDLVVCIIRAIAGNDISNSINGTNATVETLGILVNNQLVETLTKGI